MRYLEITDVKGREILDSRGNPTVEAEVTVLGRYTGRASVPSGASTGQFEAVELRDKKERYGGMGVENAVSHINNDIAEIILHKNALNQNEIDRLMIETDGTKNKGRLGANAVLGVSMATARACALALGIPLYRYLGGVNCKVMPVPMMNILNGGRHADNTVDFQEFMIMPTGAHNFREGLRMCSEVYHTLKKILNEHGLSTGIGDEGGFAPDLKNAEEVLDVLVAAIKQSGYMPDKEIKIAIDAAASEMYDEKSQKYIFEGETKMTGKAVSRDTNEMIKYYEKLISKYPVCSIEDGLDEEDWEGWRFLTEKLGNRVQLVGDDLFVTNTVRLKKGIEFNAANSVLIKVNQIGTLTEAFDAMEMAAKAGYSIIVSHRSGETADPIIADIALATNAGQIKTGAPCRADRTEKYNQLLRIAEEIGENQEYRKI